MTEFNGSLTIQNCEKIAKMIEEKLSGKRYVFSAWNEGYSFDSSAALDVRVNLTMSDGGASIYLKENHAGFNFSDGYVWGASTHKNDSDLINRWDSTYSVPYIVIEHRSVRIVHRAPAGHMLIWVISIMDTEN